METSPEDEPEEREPASHVRPAMIHLPYLDWREEVLSFFKFGHFRRFA